MPAKQYVVLHDFHTVVDDETGKEKAFAPGDTYDGPEARIEVLLAGVDFHGPLIAAKSDDDAKDAIADARAEARARAADKPADSAEGK